MARFEQVSALAEEMATEGSRLRKRARIAEELTKVHTDNTGDTALFCLYLAGLPFAASDPRKLNAGGALLSKAVKLVSEATDAELTAAYRRHGDMGAAAYDVFRDHHLNGPGLELREVAEAFAGMATAKTTAIRAALVEGLLRQGTALDAKYLLKLMLGDMRIGVKESLVEEGIAVAAACDVAAVRHSVMLEADLGHAAERAFAGTLAEARMRLFHPLGFMLASPVESAEEAIERFTAKPPKPAPEKKPKRRKKTDPEPEADLDPTLDPAMAEALANDVESAMLEEESPAPAFEATPGVQAFMEDKYDGMRAQLHCGASQETTLTPASNPAASSSTPATAKTSPKASPSSSKPSAPYAPPMAPASSSTEKFSPGTTITPRPSPSPCSASASAASASTTPCAPPSPSSSWPSTSCSPPGTCSSQSLSTIGETSSKPSSNRSSKSPSPRSPSAKPPSNESTPKASCLSATTTPSASPAS